MGIFAPSIPAGISKPTVPSIFPLRIGGGVQLLLSLPEADDTGKLIVGSWARSGVDTLRLADHEGIIRANPGTSDSVVSGGYVPFKDGRNVHNLWPAADGSEIPSTQTFTVNNGAEYQLQIGAESASGATAVCSGAFTGTLTGDGVNIISWNSGSPKTSGSTSLTVTISGSIRKIQLTEVTGQAIQVPSEYQVTDSSNSLYGYAIYATANANTVDGSGAVTEAVGSDLSPIPAIVHWPASTNLIIRSEELNQWTTNGNCTVTIDDSEAPDGRVTLEKLEGVSAAANGKLKECSLANSNDYFVSIYLTNVNSLLTRLGIHNSDTSLWEGYLDIAWSAAAPGGVPSTDANSGASHIIYSNLRGNLWCCSFKFTSSGNAGAETTNFHIHPDRNNTVKAVHAGNAQVEALLLTPYIPTITVAVSRDATDTQELVTSNINLNSFTLRVKMTPIAFAQTDLSATDEGIVSIQDDATSILFMDSGGLKSTDGTNVATINPSFAADTEIEIIVRASAELNELQIGYYDGSWTWGTITSYTGTPATGTNINLFYGLVSGGCAMGLFEIYNKDMIIAEIEALP